MRTMQEPQARLCWRTLGPWKRRKEDEGEMGKGYHLNREMIHTKWEVLAIRIDRDMGVIESNMRSTCG